MKRYKIQYEYRGRGTAEVEAESEEDAIQKGEEEGYSEAMANMTSYSADVIDEEEIEDEE